MILASSNTARIAVHPLFPRVKVRSLFEWRPDRDRAVSTLVSGLKNGSSPDTWKWLSQVFFEQHKLDITLPTAPAILAIPASAAKNQGFGFNPSLFNHAELWGRELARTFDCEFFDILTKTGGFESPQKQRTRTQRLKRAGNLRLSENVGAGSFIVADDVLTTGSTTGQVIDAFFRSSTRSKVIEIWVLATRSRLAP